MTTPFPVRIETADNPLLHKRAYYYLSFRGDSGVVVPDLAHAAFFTIVDSYLVDVADNEYVGVNASNTHQILQKYMDKSVVSGGWSLDESNRQVSLAGNNFTFGGGNAIFCALSNDSVGVAIKDAPAACKIADVAAETSKLALDSLTEDLE